VEARGEVAGDRPDESFAGQLVLRSLWAYACLGVCGDLKLVTCYIVLSYSSLASGGVLILPSLIGPRQASFDTTALRLALPANVWQIEGGSVRT